MSSINFNKNLPYGLILGVSSDGARYPQDDYRFFSNGIDIGDETKLLAARKKNAVDIL